MGKPVKYKSMMDEVRQDIRASDFGAPIIRFRQHWTGGLHYIGDCTDLTETEIRNEKLCKNMKKAWAKNE